MDGIFRWIHDESDSEDAEERRAEQMAKSAREIRNYWIAIHEPVVKFKPGEMLKHKMPSCAERYEFRRSLAIFEKYLPETVEVDVDGDLLNEPWDCVVIIYDRRIERFRTNSRLWERAIEADAPGHEWFVKGAI